jgi:hypothetical protein
MDNKTKILVGIGLAGIAYLIWKNKKAQTSAASVHLPVEKIDEQIKKVIPKEETPATPSTPSTPSTPATPASPAAPSTPSTPASEVPVIPAIPDFDFEQYFKDHPIVIDPNIGSSLVNTNIVNTDPFAQYNQNCMSAAEWLKRKEEGTLPPINSYCVAGDALIISDKDRLQNAFQMKDVQNEISRDPLGLNTFMQQGKDYTYLDPPEYPIFQGENNNGVVYNRFSCDPFGFGGIPSC